MSKKAKSNQQPYRASKKIRRNRKAKKRLSTDQVSNRILAIFGILTLLLAFVSVRTTTGDSSPESTSTGAYPAPQSESVAAIAYTDKTNPALTTNETLTEVRYANSVPSNTTISGRQITDRGFTGHKHDDELGLIYMNGRYYVPSIGRFVSPDPLVPEPTNPQGFNRYSYVINNPINLVDPSGHCWGHFSFVRDWNFSMGGSTYGMGTNCNNIDSALTIVQHPDATTEDKLAAGSYLGGWGVAAVSGAAGGGLFACSAAAPCAAFVEGAVGIGTAVSADGDPLNEISALSQADLSSVQQFVTDAQTINSARGFASFGERWNLMSQYLLQAGRNANMFIARAGGRISGMMRVNTDSGMYQIKELEGIGGGAGTNLFTHALQDSLARGYSGVYLSPADQAVSFYSQFPGYQVLANGQWYWSAEAIQAILASQGG